MTLRLQSAAFRFAAFLALPLAAILLVRTELFQAPGLDAYIYAAYAHDYADLVGRYGRTYYSTRLAHILPNAVAVSLLGDRAGYFIVRYLLLVAATASIYHVSRHYCRAPAAWFNTVFFSTHVWLLNELFWDHYSGSVVVLSLVGIALLLPRRYEIPCHVGAGFAFAWAANGNPFALAIAAAYAPAWIMDRRGRRMGHIGKSLLAGGTGFVLGYSVLVFAMVSLYPDGGWRFEEVTIDMLRYLLTGGGGTWFKSLAAILLVERWYEVLIFPFFAALALLALLLSVRNSEEQRWKTLGAATFVLMTTAIFATFHFALHWGLLSLHFYLIYALPACVTGMAALIGQMQLTTQRNIIVVALTVFFMLQFAFWFAAYPLFSPENSHLFTSIAWSSIAVAFAFLACLAALVLWRPATSFFPFFFLVALLASNAFFLQNGFFRIYGDGDRRQFEWDVRDGSLYLQRFVAEHVPTRAPIRFWYGTRDRNLDSVQSSHLWGFSRLSASGASNAQMPTIDKGVEERLAPAHYLAILGTDAEIEAARAALENAGLKTDSIARGSFKGRDWPGYDVLLLAVRRS
jgi:hypothetical protein